MNIGRTGKAPNATSIRLPWEVVQIYCLEYDFCILRVCLKSDMDENPSTFPRRILTIP